MKNLFTWKQIALASAIFAQGFLIQAQDMDKMWGDTTTKDAVSESDQKHLFDWGNYAMFIHWGLYSNLGNQWKGKTYYGIGEWMMNGNMAGIPAEEYMELAEDFNPYKFDAEAITKLAKDAGMKYIIITSKHHDGFAMFDSKTCDFNIVEQTPFGRDPMKELAEACKKYGLGMGFYYSHNQDWTYPGGTGGPSTDKNGNSKNFDDYFWEKCYPQVNEITTNYGDIELVWFDTPGGMPKKYAEELVNLVHKNQPNALVSGRVGYDMGDYQTLGDMEIPEQNVDGLWESVDVTNDSWGYAWYDQNWKTPKQIITTLISTVGRGGTFMLNVGPNGEGCVPAPAQAALRSAGKWIAEHPQVVYGAKPSPWNHALPWGDVTVNDGKLYLSIYEWPTSETLYVPGWSGKIKSLSLITSKGKQKLSYRQEGSWLCIDLPMNEPQAPVSVIELVPENDAQVDSKYAVDPEFGVTISTLFANVENGQSHKKYWMEKFGEWKTTYVVDGWVDGTTVSWDFDIKEPGYYLIELNYAGDGRMVWQAISDEGKKIQNQQGASQIYNTHSIGWMEFTKAGPHTITIKMLEGNKDTASLQKIGIKHVKL